MSTSEIVPVSVETPEWSNEALLLAALVNRKGGRVVVKQSEIAAVTGLAFHVDGEKSSHVIVTAQSEKKK